MCIIMKVLGGFWMWRGMTVHVRFTVHVCFTVHVHFTRSCKTYCGGCFSFSGPSSTTSRPRWMPGQQLTSSLLSLKSRLGTLPVLLASFSLLRARACCCGSMSVWAEGRGVCTHVCTWVWSLCVLVCLCVLWMLHAHAYQGCVYVFVCVCEFLSASLVCISATLNTVHTEEQQYIHANKNGLKSWESGGPWSLVHCHARVKKERKKASAKNGLQRWVVFHQLFHCYC